MIKGGYQLLDLSNYTIDLDTEEEVTIEHIDLNTLASEKLLVLKINFRRIGIAQTIITTASLIRDKYNFFSGSFLIYSYGYYLINFSSSYGDEGYVLTFKIDKLEV
jgi:hypothetical protein